MHVFSGLAWVITTYQLLIAFITASSAEKEVSFLTGVVTKIDTGCFLLSFSPLSLQFSFQVLSMETAIWKKCAEKDREREKEAGEKDKER